MTACGVLAPMGAPPTGDVTLQWARRLYPLGTLVQNPQEQGLPMLLPGGAGRGADRIIVPTRDRRIRAVDASYGAILWETTTGGPNVAQPVAVGDALLVGSVDGRVYRLRQDNGRALWTSEPVGRGGIITTPTVDGGQVFVTSTDNRLTALELETGKVLWDRRRSHPAGLTITGQAGAAVVGDRVVTGFSDGHVFAFSREDGATHWSVDLSRGETEFVDCDLTPVVVGETLVVGCYRSGLVGLSLAEGEVLWRLEGEGFGNPALAGGTLYVPQATGSVLAVDAVTGKVLWQTRLRIGVPSTPAVGAHRLLVPTEEALLVLDRGSGRVRTSYSDGFGFSATPVLVRGTAYAVANSGHLYALAIH